MVQFQLDNFQMPGGYGHGHQYADDGEGGYDEDGENGNDYNDYDGLNDEGEYEEV